MRVYMGELVRAAEATLSEGEVGESENSGESEVDKLKNSACESEGELSVETSSATLDKSDAESAYDMQTVRPALRSPRRVLHSLSRLQTRSLEHRSLA